MPKGPEVHATASARRRNPSLLLFCTIIGSTKADTKFLFEKRSAGKHKMETLTANATCSCLEEDQLTSGRHLAFLELIVLASWQRASRVLGSGRWQT